MTIISAFIMPHPPIILAGIGKGEEKKIAATQAATQEVARRIADLAPETIVISSPHIVMYSNYFHLPPGAHAYGSMQGFGAGNIQEEAACDEEFINLLSQEALQNGLPAGTEGSRDKEMDHGTLLPLHFVNEIYTKYKLVRVGLSGLSPLEHYRLGKCIAQTSARLNRRTVFIASGDLSHRLKEDGPYGFAPEGSEFDRQVTEIMATGNFGRLLTLDPEFCEEAAECGLRSFIIMAGALDSREVRPELLSYEGPFGVGYAVCAFNIGRDNSERCFDIIYRQEYQNKLQAGKKTEDEYVRLARLALETYLRTGKQLKTPADLPQELTHKRAGIFVSLKKYGLLRGCIGTIEPATDCIADEIIRNALHSGLNDQRFDPVTEDELDDLVYSVDVLGRPEDIASPAELDVKRYGVIVTKGGRRGLLLPDLKGVDTPQKQIAVALQKAGITPHESYRLSRFEVVRHK